MAIAGACGLLLFITKMDEGAGPRHKGKTAKQWFKVFCNERFSTTSPPVFEAQEGIVALGAHAAPALKEGLRETFSSTLPRRFPKLSQFIPASVFDEAVLVRHLASEAFGWSTASAKAALPELVRGVADTDAKVRLNCIQALAQINCGNPEIDNALMTACSDPDPSVSQLAARALAHTGLDTPEARAALKNPVQEDLWMLTGFGYEIHTPHPLKRETIEEQMADLERISPLARAQAVRALRTNYTEAAKIVPALTRRLKDDNQRVSIIAVEVLAEYGTNASTALPALREMNTGTNHLHRHKLDNAIRLIEGKAVL